MKRVILSVLCMAVLLSAGCGKGGTQTGELNSITEETNSSDSEIEQSDNLISTVGETESLDVNMTFPGDDEVKIKLSGAAFVEAITKNDSIKMTLYNSKEGLRMVRD